MEKVLKECIPAIDLSAIETLLYETSHSFYLDHAADSMSEQRKTKRQYSISRYHFISA
jgi:hypothetical protein